MLTTKSLVSFCLHTFDPLYPFAFPILPSPMLTIILFSVAISLFFSSFVTF